MQVLLDDIMTEVQISDFKLFQGSLEISLIG